ncbi:hypothetical protein [Hyalangium versicolor]|uniref:hypothetical protein n=1 Tax=Hyalangium versicolor TaxID=2861190 RepID=UPI001CCE7EF1|nr:hypothetical protein [Hyalangium versicolor]
MRQSGFRVWKVFGGLAAVALLSSACGYLPMTGGKRPDDPPQRFWGNAEHHKPPDFYSKFQYSPDRGYNGTIRDLGSSIDPRTPEKAGAFGKSRMLDVTGRPAPESPSLSGYGGSGSAGYEHSPEQ